MSKRRHHADAERLLTEVIDALADIGQGKLERRLALPDDSPLAVKLAAAFDAAVARIQVPPDVSPPRPSLPGEFDKDELSPDEIGLCGAENCVFFGRIQDGVFIVQDGKLQFVNEVYANTIGYTVEELIGKSFSSIVAPEDQALVVRRHERRLAGESVTDRYAFRLLHKDGTRIHVSMSVGVIEYKGEAATLGTTRDITLQTIAETELRKSSTEMRALLAAMTDVIIVIDGKGLYHKVMSSDPSLLLDTPNELVGKRLHDLFPKSKADKFVHHIQRALEARQPVNFEYPLDIKGEEMYFAATISPMKQDRVLWVARDITAYKQTQAELRDMQVELEQRVEARAQELKEHVSGREQAEEALAQERNLLRTLIDNLPASVYIKDTDSRFVVTNQANASFLGIESPDEALGKSDADFYPAELAEHYLADERALLQSGEPVFNREETITDQTTGEQGWLSTTKVPLHDAQGQIVGLIGIGQDITEQKRVEQSLLEERNLLRILIDNLPSLIFVKDTEHRFLILNTAILQRLRVETFSEAIGKTDFDFFPADAATQGAHEDEKQVLQGEPLINRVETFPDFETGGTKWFSTNKFPVRNAQGEVVGLVCISHDITAQEQTKGALKSLQQVIQNSPGVAILWQATEGLPVKYISSNIERFGYTTEDFYTGRISYDDIVHPDDQDRTIAEARRYTAEGRDDYSQTYRIITASGEIRWVSDFTGVERDANGKITRFRGLVFDITGQREAEQALAEERALLRALIDNVPDYIYAKDTEGRFVVNNKAHLQLLGAATQENVFGKTDLDIFPGEIAQQCYSEGQALIRSGTSMLDHEERVINQATGAEQWVLSTKVPIRDYAGNVSGLVGIARDITAQKSATEEREHLLTMLEKRNAQSQTAAEVSVAASDILDLDELQRTLVNLVQERFDLYYAGLFLVDEDGAWTGEPDRWAVLRAGTGTAGTEMLAARHKLRLDDESMIGWCITHGEARIALDVGDDPVRFDNPHLPDTHSELALPLISRGHVSGALTIQSTEETAFHDEDIIVLQTLAHQVANAIENARLFEKTQSALAEMQAVEQRFRDVALSTSDWVWETDPEGRYTYCSGRVMEVLGYTTEEILGQTPFDFMLPEEAERSMKQFGEVVANRQPIVNLENWNRHKDGHEVCLVTSGVPMFDGEGNLLGYRGVDQDITTQKRAEQALADERNLLRTVIDTLPEFVYAKDTESRFVLNNVLHLNALGVTTQGEVLGKTDLDIFPRELAGEYYSDEQEIFRSGQPMVDKEELFVHKATGKKGWVSATKVPLFDLQGKITGLVGVSRDITAQKQTAEEHEHLLAMAAQRSAQLQTAAEVSAAATEILDLEELQQRVVDLICDRFDLYYVGLFLVDLDGRWTGIPWNWAALRAGTGEAGQVMRAKKHKLEIGGASMIGQCIAFAEARIALKADEGDARFDNPLLPETRSEMALPLVARGQVIGALSIQSAEEEAFSDEDVIVVQTLANQVANAIENARLFEDVQQRARRRRTQYEAGIALSEATETTEIFNIAVERLAILLDVPEASIFTYNKVREMFTRQAGYGPVSEAMAGDEIPVHVSPGAQQALDEQRPVIEASIPPDDPKYDFAREKGFTASMILPLMLGNEPVGLIFLDETRGPRHFLDEEVDAVVSLGNQIAIMLENRHLLEQTQTALDETNFLYQTTRSLLAHTSVQDTYEELVTRCALPGIDLVEALELDTESDPQELEVMATWNSRPDDAPVGFRVKLSTWPGSSTYYREPYVVNDTANHPGYTEAQREYCSRMNRWAFALVGVRIQDRLLGIINLQSAIPNVFTDKMILQIESIASQVAMILDNQRLLQQTQVALADTDALYQAIAQLNALETYEDVIDVLRRHTVYGKADLNISLNLFNRPWVGDDMPEVASVAARWSRLPDESTTQRYALHRFPAARLLSPHEPLVIADIDTDPRLDEQARALYTQMFKAKSTIFVSLVVAGQWIGYVNAIYGRHTEFTKAELRRLTSLGGQAAIAVESIRQLDQVQSTLRETAILYEAGQALDRAEDETDVLMAAANYSINEGAVIASLMYLNVGDSGQPEQATVMAAWAAYKIDVLELTMVGTRYDLLEFPLAELWTSSLDQPQLIGNLQKDSRIDAETLQHVTELGERAMVIMPLAVGGRWVGLVVLVWPRPQAFDTRDEQVYKGLRDQIAVSVNNRRLATRTQNALEEIRVAQTALSEERSLLRTLIDTLPDNIYIKDRESRFLLYNAVCRQILGVDTSEAAVGKSDFDFLPEELASKYYADDQTVIQSGEPIVDLEEIITGLTSGEQSWLSTTRVPLRDSENNITGIIGVGRDITAQKNAAAELEHLIEVTQQALFETEMLYEASRSITSGGDFDEMFNGIVNYAVQHGADRVAVSLWRNGDGQANRMEMAGQWDRDHARQDVSLKDSDLMVLAGLFRMGDAPPLVIDDLDTESARARMAPATFRAIREDLDARSFAIFPIAAGGEVIGILVLIYRSMYSFTDDERRAYQSLTGQAAVVIRGQGFLAQTQRALEEARRQYEATQRIADATKLSEMLLALCHFAAGAISSSILTLFERDAQSGDLAVAYTPVMTTGDEVREVDFTQSIYDNPMAALYQEILEGEPITIQNVENSPLLNEDSLAFLASHNAKSLLSLPLVTGGQVIGMVMLGASGPHAFSQAEVRALYTLAGQISITYHNQRLLAQTEQDLYENQLLFTIGQDILRAETPHELARVVLANIFPDLAAATLVHYKLDDAGDIVDARLAASVEISDEASHKERLETIRKHMKPNTPLLVNNLDESTLFPPREIGLLKRGHIASFAVFPMGARGKLGMVAITHDKPYIFSAQDERIGRIVAGQIVTQLENQMLLYDTQEQADRLETLNELSQSLSATLELDEILGVVSQKAFKLLSVDRTSICLYNHEDQTLRIASLEGGDVQALTEGKKLPLEGTGVGQALRSGEAHIVADLRDSINLDDQGLFKQGIRSTMVVPLIAGGRALGTLNFGSQRPSFFDEDDLVFVSQAAHLIAVAMENARLFAEARARAAREETVSRIAAQLQERMDLETMLQTTLRELGTALDAKRARVRLQVRSGQEQREQQDEESQR